jgi:hypothetical protein
MLEDHFFPVFETVFFFQFIRTNFYNEQHGLPRTFHPNTYIPAIHDYLPESFKTTQNIQKKKVPPSTHFRTYKQMQNWKNKSEREK